MADNSKCKNCFLIRNSFPLLAETVKSNDDQTEKQSSASSFNNVNTSTNVRLFGQFKSNGNGFSNFGKLSSNGSDSSPTTTTNTTTSYFTSTLSQFSSTNTGRGFGSSSTSLAASLAPLTSRYEIVRCLVFSRFRNVLL